MSAWRDRMGATVRSWVWVPRIETSRSSMVMQRRKARRVPAGTGNPNCLNYTAERARPASCREPSMCPGPDSGQRRGRPLRGRSEAFDTRGAAEDHHVRRPRGKQPDGDHAHDLVDGAFQCRRVADLQPVYVEYVIAIVGEHPIPPHRLAAELLEGTAHVRARHGDHLDGQRELAEHVEPLAPVGDTDESAGRRGDDLLAGQGRAPALDELPLVIGFIGAVDVGIDLTDVVEIEYPVSRGFESAGGCDRARHRTGEFHTVRRKLVDEEVHRRTRADSQDHAWLDEFERGARRGLFSGVLVHLRDSRGAETTLPAWSGQCLGI